MHTFHYIHVLSWYASYAYHFGNKMPITNLLHVYPCYIITTSNELLPRYKYVYIHYSKELKEHMLRTAYLEYHKCYNLIMLYASRGLCKLRNKSRFNYQCGGDNACRCRCASTPPYMDWIYWLTETFKKFELSNY